MFGYVFGEPGVEGGIAFEDHTAAHAGEAPGVELVSRGVQSTLGLAVSMLLYGVAIGGIFALVYAVVYVRGDPGESSYGIGDVGAGGVRRRVRRAVPEVPGQPTRRQRR